jgi:glyoxylase-like metal-dependent hydrolase (beta-lactamase superfamily II)
MSDQAGTVDGPVTGDPLHEFDIVLVRAPNPGPLTLSGTNSWIVGRDPAWVIDPGPAITEHLDALAAELHRRGGAGGIALTHSHADHVGGLPGLLERLGSDVAVGAGAGSGRPLSDGASFGPFTVIALPGHARDHLGFLWPVAGGAACFTGDAVLGEGSVFVSGDMAGYLDGLTRVKALAPRILCPGHGPVVADPEPHIDAYVAHRLQRERRVADALAAGVREEADLLAAAWGDVPVVLREAARLTLRAHLAKLRDDGSVSA